MSFLLDTNIVSELRRGPAANPGVVKWFDDRSPRELYLSVVTIGEIRQGMRLRPPRRASPRVERAAASGGGAPRALSVDQLRPRDDRQSVVLDRWLTGLVQFYEDRLLYVDGEVAEEWGRLRAHHRAPVIDTLLAATARIHELTLVTRNTRDFRALEVQVVNPFAG